MADDDYKNSSSLISTMAPTDDDFISELTHQMSCFMLQDDDDHDHDSFDFSSNSEPWDLTSSPDSTLWSPVSCNQGSSEGSSQEASPPATPCWKTTTYEERAISKHNIGEVISSHKALIQEQIKAIEVKQHYINDIKKQHQHAMSPKQNDDKQEIEKKGNGRNRPVLPRLPRPTPLQIDGVGVGGGGGMRAVFIGDSCSRNGTGVFLPRGRTVVAPSESTKKKQGKGCSTVLIPARVVQALQLHFDKTAAMSRGPKVVDFPPLRDLVLSNRESMYSLENQRSTKSPNDVQNDMILPNEWTY